VFSNAPWKAKTPAAKGREATGIGVFCQFQQEQHKRNVFVQASSEKVPSPLQA
jgi:hypothetical protein